MISMLLSALLMVGDTPVATQIPAAAVQKLKKERKICRVPEVQTGTRMRQRVCKTESEWAKRDEGHSADDLKTMGSQ